METILQPQTESERRKALHDLWQEVENGTDIPPLLHDFIRHHHTHDWVQSALIGLLLWHLDGKEQPVEPYILVRIFPGLFADEEPSILAAAQQLFGDLSAEEFFNQTSNRNLFDEEKDADEAWYGTRILSNYNVEISKAYDNRQQNR